MFPEKPTTTPHRTSSTSNSPSSSSMKRHNSSSSSSTAWTTSDGGSSTEDPQQQQHHGGWLGDITSLARSARSTIDGVAGMIHRSAMNVAAEISQLEREQQGWDYGGGNNNGGGATRTNLPLPWERLQRIQPQQQQQQPTTKSQTNNHKKTDDNKVEGQLKSSPPPPPPPIWVEDEELRDRILDLATDEKTFLEPYSCKEMMTMLHSSNDEDEFYLDEPRVHLIRRLLELDGELAFMHARLSGRSEVKEAIFWRNYFYHCDAVRRDYLGGSDDEEDDDDEDDDENHDSNDDDDVSDLEDLEDVEVASRSTVGSMVITRKQSSVGYEDGSFVCVKDGGESVSVRSSVGTVTDTLSLGDLVLVGANGGDLTETLEKTTKTTK